MDYIFVETYSNYTAAIYSYVRVHKVELDTISLLFQSFLAHLNYYFELERVDGKFNRLTVTS